MPKIGRLRSFCIYSTYLWERHLLLVSLGGPTPPMSSDCSAAFVAKDLHPVACELIGNGIQKPHSRKHILLYKNR